MDVSTMPIGQLVSAIAIIGALSAAFYKVFSVISDVKYNKESIKKLKLQMQSIETEMKHQRDEVLDKVEETNDAVNLLCSAVSALLSNAISDDNIEELKQVKQKLDSKKEII